MTSRTKDYLGIARRFYEQNHSDAECGFVAGSFTRGEMKVHSDIDMVVLYKSDKVTPRRYACLFEGMPFEVFVHNLRANAYFFDSDSKRGTCVMPSIVSTGTVVGKNKKLAQERKKISQAIIKKGPALFSPAQINESRYRLTDALDDLRDPRPKEQVFGILATLWHALGDFYLRAQGKWSGNGKSLGRLLKEANPSFARKYTKAFEEAHQGNIQAVLKLGETILEPYGGTLWVGHEAKASDDWKKFTPVISKNKKPVRRQHS